MPRSVRVLPIVLALLLCAPNVAWAGMPSVNLSDIARMRVQTISFFLAGLLVSACARLSR